MSDFYRLAGRRQARERPVVGTLQRPARSDPVALGEDVLKRETDVGTGLQQDTHPVAEALDTGGSPGSGRGLVLVHGSSSRGWARWKVTLHLRGAGHEVYTPNPRLIMLDT